MKNSMLFKNFMLLQWEGNTNHDRGIFGFLKIYIIKHGVEFVLELSNSSNTNPFWN